MEKEDEKMADKAGRSGRTPRCERKMGQARRVKLFPDDEEKIREHAKRLRLDGIEIIRRCVTLGLKNFDEVNLP